MCVVFSRHVGGDLFQQPEEAGSVMKAWGALWGSAPLLWAGGHAEGTEGSELVWILEYSTRPSREATSWSRRTWCITHTEQSVTGQGYPGGSWGGTTPALLLRGAWGAQLSTLQPWKAHCGAFFLWRAGLELGQLSNISDSMACPHLSLSKKLGF